jgi:hypothetical protein
MTRTPSPPEAPIPKGNVTGVQVLSDNWTHLTTRCRGPLIQSPTVLPQDPTSATRSRGEVAAGRTGGFLGPR